VRARRPATVVVRRSVTCASAFAASFAATRSSSADAAANWEGSYDRRSAKRVTETAEPPLRAATPVPERETCQPAGTWNVKPGPSTARFSAAFRPAEPQAARMRRAATGRIAPATGRKERLTMTKTKDKVSDAAASVKPYVDRALQDPELRENVRNAYESARSIYDELIGNRGVSGAAKRVATDREIQDELRSAITELRTAADRVRGRQEQHSGRNSGLLLLGIVLAILFNPVTGPQTRKWLADRLFGGDGDFTYQGENGGPAA
jgi:hypothetical protein